MAQVEVLFTDGKIVTAGKIIEGFVAVDKEKIVAVGEGDRAPQALKTIDLNGRALIPGIVDPEVHFGSHRWVGDEFDSETRGAAAYGITTWGFMQPSANMGQPYKAEKTAEEVPLYADAFGLFKELGEARSMVDFFLTPKILKDEHALEIPRLARDFGITSFKYQLHLMSPERTQLIGRIERARAISAMTMERFISGSKQSPSWDGPRSCACIARTGRSRAFSRSVF